MKVIINGKHVPLGGNNDKISTSVADDTSSDDSNNTDYEALFGVYISWCDNSSVNEAEKFIKDNILKKEKEEEEKKKILYDALSAFQNFIKIFQTEEDEEKKRKRDLEDALAKMKKEMGLEGKEPDKGRDDYYY